MARTFRHQFRLFFIGSGGMRFVERGGGGGEQDSLSLPVKRTERAGVDRERR